MSTLISRKELFDELKQDPTTDTDELTKCLFDATPDEERSQNAVNWLTWVHREKLLKAISFTIPAGILPDDLTGEMTDVKVQSRGPDDKVYDTNAEYRAQIARGNCIMNIRNGKAGKASADCVIFALKKFTGGLGDDDDRDIGDGFVWQKYFTKPISATERVICTKKMNGEAAHFAVRWIGNDFYIIAGSKNVHLLFRTAEDIEKYEESRFLVARDVARTCFQFFSAMEARRRSALFSFFHHTKYTAVLEILLPHYQHVEDLSYLAAPELYFISWSRTDFGTGFREEICVAPDFGQKIAQDFGLKVTGYEVVLYADLTKKLTDIRKAHGYEGEVLYFIDKEGKVIGLLKKKTIWYIILRAIREKAKNGASTFRATKKHTPTVNEKFDLTKVVAGMRKRLSAIRQWIGMDAVAISAWECLAVGFLKWLGAGLEARRIDEKTLFSQYPVLWNRYLKETGQSDRIDVATVTCEDDADKVQPTSDSKDGEEVEAAPEDESD